MRAREQTEARSANANNNRRRLVRIAIVLSAPLALLDLQCRTDFRDAVVGGAYDFVTAKTFDALEQLFGTILGTADLE